MCLFFFLWLVLAFLFVLWLLNQMHLSSTTNPVYGSSVSSRAWTCAPRFFRLKRFFLCDGWRFYSENLKCFLVGMKDWHQIWRLFNCERSRREGRKARPRVWASTGPPLLIIAPRTSRPKRKTNTSSSVSRKDLVVDLSGGPGVQATGRETRRASSVSNQGGLSWHFCQEWL